MQAIKASDRILEDWPAIRTTPGYEVVRGEPIPSGRLDVGHMDSAIRVGVWACTEGAFECTETGDELQTIVKGKLRIVEGDGTTHILGPGDSFFTRKGERLVWDVLEPVEKIFFTYDRDGAAFEKQP